MSKNNHGIEEKSDYQHLRIRTEMYLGARTAHQQTALIHTNDGPTIQELEWVPALVTSFREIIDNSLDEFTKANVAGNLTVSYDEANLAFEISDNGRGIPIDWADEFGCHLATLVMSKLKAGRNFDDGERKGVAGMNGLGGSAITNVSKEFEVEVTRKGRPMIDGVHKRDAMFNFTQRFFEGNPVVEDALQICDPVIKPSKSTTTGTTIRFKLSTDVFKFSTKLPGILVESILREIAAVNCQHKIVYNGTKLPTRPAAEKTLFPKQKAMTLDIKQEGFKSKFYVVPGIVPSGSFLMHSLVNNIPTYEGGHHLDTFKREFSLRLLNVLAPTSKRRKLKPNRSDVEDGMLLYNVTVMDGPHFSSQAKAKLTNDEVIKPIMDAMTDDWFNDLIKKNKDWIDAMYERCANRTNKKDDDEFAKAAKRNLKAKVAKLRDATGKEGRKVISRSECTLFITEGDSAVGGISDVRDPARHGALPLRGKILNVSDDKMTPKRLMESQAIADVMNALGLIPGVKAERSKLRYGKLCVATDMDQDGANIAALLVNFLHTYWPELFDPTQEAFVQFFMTPFVILEKGKQREYFYLDNVSDYHPEEWKGWHARRAKGLGTLQKIDWNHAVNVQLRTVPIIEDGNLKETLDLIFNKTRADDRKAWMQGELVSEEQLVKAVDKKSNAIVDFGDLSEIMLDIPSSHYINDTSRDYALYVAENRGIPCAWDGLKDGQRKALYILQKRAGEIKTISLAGEMISRNIYVHGDAAAADSIGKLAAPYQNNLPIIKGIGNFGTKTVPNDIAAPRYTYVKKNNVSEHVIYPDADIVPMMDNYDGSAQSPQHYLPIIPTVLLNGIEGMAPGFSTYILPRKVEDLIQATLDVLELKMPTTLKPGYEYTGGKVVNNGPNKWELFGDIDIVDKQTVMVTELAPGVTHEKFISHLDKLEDEKIIRDYHDETKDKIKITVRYMRGALEMKTEDQIMAQLGLIKRVTERIVVVDWDSKTIQPYNSAEELVIRFVQERFKFYVARFEKLLADVKFELKFWELMKICYDSDLPAALSKMKNKAQLVEIINGLAETNNSKATEEQIDRIASLPSYRWTQDEYQKIVDKIAELNGEITSHTDMLSDNNNIWAVYKDDVLKLKTMKFDLER